MTTYRQREYDMVYKIVRNIFQISITLLLQVINELREKEEKSKKKTTTQKTELKVTKVSASHPSMLSEKEVKDVTAVFRSLGRRDRLQSEDLEKTRPKCPIVLKDVF